MPAFKTYAAATTLLVVSIIIAFFPSTLSSVQAPYSLFSPPELGVSAALKWLVANQSSDGSYGAFHEQSTAAAAYALWLNNSSSHRARLSYSLLATELDNTSSWFWPPYGEADYPGEMLYSVAASQNLGLIHTSSVASLLLQFQKSDGGFTGYADANGNVYESSVDTSLALRGLIASNAINASSRGLVANFLLSLQNSDGSFNLTRTISFDPIYSQGPDRISITALTILTLGDTGFAADESHVSKALNFLSGVATSNFNGHVYAAAISALAFNSYGRASDASRAISFMISKQNSDGGFADSARSSAASNPLDTGWAAIALQRVQSQPLPTGLLPLLFGHLPILLFAGGVLALIVTAAALLYTRRRSALLTLEGSGP